MVCPPAAIASSLSLGLLLVGATGCAERTSGGGSDAVSDEDVEPGAYCPERDPGPVMELAAEVGAVRASACGDLVYAAGDARFWYRPGEGAVTIDAEVWSTRFAPTGHMFAFERELEDGLVLADTRTGELTELPRASSFGLVAAPGTDHGADLWTCRDGVLALDGPVAAAALAEGVACPSVVGSSGSPRVVFADDEGAVFAADLEQLEVWPIEGADYERGGFDDDGFETDDWLWIDHDGRVVAHQKAVWESDEDSDSDWRVVEGMAVHVDGELRDSWTGVGVPQTIDQVARRGAPVVVRPSGGLVVYVDGEAHDLGVGRSLDRMDLAADGRVLILDEVSRELLRLDLDEDGGAALDSVASGVEAFEIIAADDGSSAALVDVHPDCVADFDACVDGHKTIRLWREDGGLAATTPEPGLWELVAVTDAGAVLAVDEGIGDADSRLVLFDASLEPRATWTIASSGAVVPRTTETLGDGRVLAEIRAGGQGWLVVADPEAPAGERLVELSTGGSVASELVFLDASERALAFVEEDAAALDHLLAGAMPG